MRLSELIIQPPNRNFFLLKEDPIRSVYAHAHESVLQTHESLVPSGLLMLPIRVALNNLNLSIIRETNRLTDGSQHGA
jgi:hypothetical protein